MASPTKPIQDDHYSSDHGSRTSVSTTASSSPSSTSLMIKPHKANHAAWEAMTRLRQQEGRVGLEHFRLIRRVGKGDIGNVYLCQIRNPAVGSPPCFYAMKVVDREALALRKKLVRAEVEREILGLLDHPFLPTLYAEFDAEHYSCLVMEFCPGGDLYAARMRQPNRRFSISSVRFYAAETLLALEYLHMMGIVYRDLKPENVLVREDGHIMLSDFDLSFKCDVVPKLLKRKKKLSSVHDNKNSPKNSSTCTTPSCVKPVLSCLSSRIMMKKFMSTATATTTITVHPIDAIKDRDRGHDHEEDPQRHHDGNHDQEYPTELVAEPTDARSRSFVGTHEYLAPEVITGLGHGSEVDWWTFGVFLYELLYGKTPFKGENNGKTLINILKQPLTFPRIRVSSAREHEEIDKVQDLMRKLLVKNPKKRFGSLKGSVEIKKHEFFKGVNWALIRSVRPPDRPPEVPSKMISSKIRYNNMIMCPKPLSKKERDEPYKVPNHFDYF